MHTSKNVDVLLKTPSNAVIESSTLIRFGHHPHSADFDSYPLIQDFNNPNPNFTDNLNWEYNNDQLENVNKIINDMYI